jgi:hypothetical protein
VTAKHQTGICDMDIAEVIADSVMEINYENTRASSTQFPSPLECISLICDNDL